MKERKSRLKPAGRQKRESEEEDNSLASAGGIIRIL